MAQQNIARYRIMPCVLCVTYVEEDERSVLKSLLLRLSTAERSALINPLLGYETKPFCFSGSTMPYTQSRVRVVYRIYEYTPEGILVARILLDLSPPP